MSNAGAVRSGASPARAPEAPGTDRRSVAGFSLVEVAVALVILAVGLLGVAGMVAQAAGTLGRAAGLERATRALETVADSLVAAPGIVGGRRVVSGVVVGWRWSGSRLELRADGGPGVDSVLVGVVPEAAPIPDDVP